MRSTTHTVITPPAKNAALPLIYAMCLTGCAAELHDVPNGLVDLTSTLNLLASGGVRIVHKEDSVKLDANIIYQDHFNKILFSQTRYSSLLLGILGSRVGFGTIGAPGGCSLNRKLDIHVSAMRTLGFDVLESTHEIRFERKSLGATHFELRYPSVGATLNCLFIACGRECETALTNCAQEPEIIDVVNYLNSCGANIRTVANHGFLVRSATFRSSTWSTPPDRIVAGTFALAAAALRRNLTISSFRAEDNSALLELLIAAGVPHEIDYHTATLCVFGKQITSLRPVKITAKPFPGFSSDLLPILVALSTTCEGISEFRDEVYHDRYQYVPSLKAMGADLEIVGESLIVNGAPQAPQSGSRDFTAMDIRGGMASLIYAMSRFSEFCVHQPQVIRRGYASLEEFLNVFGFRSRSDYPQLIPDSICCQKFRAA